MMLKTKNTGADVSGLNVVYYEENQTNIIL